MREFARVKVCIFLNHESDPLVYKICRHTSASPVCLALGKHQANISRLETQISPGPKSIPELFPIGASRTSIRLVDYSSSRFAEFDLRGLIGNGVIGAVNCLANDGKGVEFASFPVGDDAIDNAVVDVGVALSKHHALAAALGASSPVGVFDGLAVEVFDDRFGYYGP